MSYNLNVQTEVTLQMNLIAQVAQIRIEKIRYHAICSVNNVQCSHARSPTRTPGEIDSSSEDSMEQSSAINDDRTPDQVLFHPVLVREICSCMFFSDWGSLGTKPV